MNQFILSEGRIMDFDIYTEKVINDCVDFNMMIYFVLDGEVHISFNDTKQVLRNKDFMLINPYVHHSYYAAGHSLVIRFVISSDELSKYYDVQGIVFDCDSLSGISESKHVLRNLLESCLSLYYGKRAKDGRSLLHLNGLYYQIVEMLMTSFAKYTGGADDDGMASKRINEVIRYIHKNYKQPVSLNDLSEKMYLSATYLSRYIKKKLGKNFMEYMTEVRLGYAVSELETADKTIARVALDNGFPNINSFNKAFKEHYRMTPKAYQEKYLAQKKEEKAEDTVSGNLEYRLMDYLEHKKHEMKYTPDVQAQIVADASEYSYLSKSWQKLINIGRMIMVMRSDVQEHILYLKKTLGFQYVRLWDLFDEELKLNAANKDGRHNFMKLDKIIDFLVRHEIHPYIELGFKPVILRDVHESYIVHEERVIIFDSADAYRQFLNTMMIHFINRYGIDEVAQWCFEQWCDPRLFEKGEPEKYFEVFETAYQTIKALSPKTKVGGGYDRTYGVISYRNLVAKWSARYIQPDYFSLYCYMSNGLDDLDELKNYMLDIQNADFMYRYFEAHREILRNYGMDMPIHITECNFTVVNRNVLNDSCFKGAYVMKNFMQLYPEVEMLGYWFGTDLFADSEEVPKILDGCGGLMTYDGICKPAFYAVDFMNHSGQYLLKQNNAAMVSMDSEDDYFIACHNYQHLGLQYYMNYMLDEKNLQIDKMPLMFENDSRKKINIQIKNVKNGAYYIKTRSINRKHGSIQDEWMRMGLIEDLHAGDIDYLKKVSIPRITIYQCLVENETLDIEVSLESQEIQNIHIYRQQQDGTVW